MSGAQYDVVIVGAGCAGLTAAIGLSRASFSVAVVEAAPLPGTSSIGGVFCAENLAEPDLLGPQGVETLAWERRLVERGRFVTDGRRLAGSTYRDPDAFRHCFTVLTPLFDHHLAQIALEQGVAVLSETTVASLIRERGRVLGVATSRGPLYADLVFLAEGDAGLLVSREGYDRSSDPRETPAFLYCLEQIIELPPGAIEECFRVGPEQGIAHELLLRNPSWAALNARGSVCTNRQSLTLSLVLPAENLRQHFSGQPPQLLDWLADMPALRPWWREGRRGAWTARLLRTGGLHDVPYLADDGLAVGGAAAGLGVDFPVRNTTGPASCTGLLLSRAAMRIRSEGGRFDREQLRQHYIEPLRQTRYWRDVEFLQRWPRYLRRTRVLFDQQLDLLLDSAAVWARPRRWLPRQLLSWFRVLGRVRWAQWGELTDDLIERGHALRLREVIPRPAATRILLDGALNAFRDLACRPRPHLPPAGSLRIHYSSSDDSGGAGAAPALLRRWFRRFQPVLASSAHIFHDKHDRPLSAKLTAMVDLLVRQLNLMDLLVLAGLGLLTVLASTFLDACGWVFRRFRREALMPVRSGLISSDTADRRRPIGSGSLDGVAPLIHIGWRSTHPRQRADAVRGLPHLCPTGVFDVQGEAPAVVQVRVQADRCIACQACWRINPSVDWGHLGARPLRWAVHSPLLTRLLEAEDRAGLARPAAPQRLDPWSEQDHSSSTGGSIAGKEEVIPLLGQLDRKLSEFEGALAHGPGTIDRPRSDHLEILARYAQQLAVRVREILHRSAWPTDDGSRQRVLDLAAALLCKAEERVRRTWDGRFAWAVADGRLLRQHHLAGLLRLLGQDASALPCVVADTSQALRPDWIPSAIANQAEDACIKHLLADIAARRYLLETLELAVHQEEKKARAELLAALIAEVRRGLTARTMELHGHAESSESDPVNNRLENAETFDRHGRALIAPGERLQALLDITGDWQTLEQRRALRAERQEILEAEQRLVSLAEAWRNVPHEGAAQTAVSTGFGRQAAYLLAEKLLLLRTFDRLEQGLDAELAIALLRVWLDYTARLLDEFTMLVRGQMYPAATSSDRPLVEFDSGVPPRTVEEYFAAPSVYSSGDFLLAPVDLLQPRLVPEMIHSAEEIAALVDHLTEAPQEKTDKKGGNNVLSAQAAELLHAATEVRDPHGSPAWHPERLYMVETLAVEALGRRAHPRTPQIELELACARMLTTDLSQHGDALRERCTILRALTDEVMPRWLRGDIETRVRHLGREVLELETLKEDFRRRLSAVWQTYGDALGHNADVQASCFALAEAAAWLKAADCVLGRMAWVGRLAEVEEREEPAELQNLGRRVLAHCRAEARDRLFRFDEDLAALRRGYYAPHVRAASLLRLSQPERSATLPVSDIQRPIRVLVIVEPLPALLTQPKDGGEAVLESHWTLEDGDRSAVENALRLRDAAPERVKITIAAIGPPRVGQALRPILSLGIEPVRLLLPEPEIAPADRAAKILANALEEDGPFDLILGAQHERHGITLLAETLGLSAAGHAAEVVVRANTEQACALLRSGNHPVRERPLPAAVVIEARLPLRPFTIAGYLAGLRRTIQPVTT